jgi:uncharacterized protein (DUF362 family)
MTVLFDKVTKYSKPEIIASLHKAFRVLGVDLTEKQKVFIKVNVVRPAKPKSCVVTHPSIVEALISVLREKGIPEILIGEGPAAGVNSERAFKKSGYRKLARRMNVRLIDLHNAERVEREWRHGCLELPLDLIKSDLYINVCKMKTHYHTGVTLSVKSQQGLLTPDAKKANHRDYDLHKSLVDIAQVIQPDLTVVDGIVSMEGEGPTQGDLKPTGVLVFGDNPFETDVACCEFMGISPSQIEHINHAVKEGLVPFEQEVKGDAFQTNRVDFKLPSPKPKKLLNFYSWKNYRACAQDDHCFEEAIHLALKKPRYWVTFFPKFMYFVLFKRFDLIRGKRANVPTDSDRVLCIGNCSKDAAGEDGRYFVPGCPPDPEEILKTISRMK